MDVTGHFASNIRYLTYQDSLGTMVHGFRSIGSHLQASNTGTHSYLTHTAGNTPAIDLLSKLPVPCSTVYGSDDTIAPSHQGKVLGKLLGIPSFVIADTGHTPFKSKSTVQAFVTILLSAYKMDHRVEKEIRIANPEYFASTFSTHDTNIVIEELYKSLLEIE